MEIFVGRGFLIKRRQEILVRSPKNRHGSVTVKQGATTIAEVPPVSSRLPAWQWIWECSIHTVDMEVVTCTAPCIVSKTECDHSRSFNELATKKQSNKLKWNWKSRQVCDKNRFLESPVIHCSEHAGVVGNNKLTGTGGDDHHKWFASRKIWSVAELDEDEED